MMVSGTTINAMDMEFTQIKKELDMKAIGKMTLNQVKELKYGQKEANMLVNMKMERSKDTVLIHGLMALFTKEIGLTIELMELVNINGKMEENTMETGIITICMEWEFIFILMELHMRVSIRKIRKLDMAFISGPTVESMKVGGIMVNNME